MVLVLGLGLVLASGGFGLVVLMRERLVWLCLAVLRCGWFGAKAGMKLRV